MTREWLKDQETTFGMLMEHGIPRNLGYDLMAQVAEWAAVTHQHADFLHRQKILDAERELKSLLAMPQRKAPVTDLYGEPTDKFVQRSAQNGYWETTREKMAAHTLSLELVREILEHLQSQVNNPELDSCPGVEPGDRLWIASTGSTYVLLLVVPSEWEEEVASTVCGTGLRCRTIPEEGLDSGTCSRVQDNHPVDVLRRLPDFHQEWAKRNLGWGAARLWDLVIPDLGKTGK